MIVAWWKVPTDCPQRDERLGWMGDASLSAASMLVHWTYKDMASGTCNYSPLLDVQLHRCSSVTSNANAWSKVSAFLDSVADELGTDGSLPDVVPYQRFGGRPADLSWSAAFLENLWNIWDREPRKISEALENSHARCLRSFSSKSPRTVT